jgi:hypothetical protein
VHARGPVHETPERKLARAELGRMVRLIVHRSAPSCREGDSRRAEAIAGVPYGGAVGRRGARHASQVADAAGGRPDRLPRPAGAVPALRERSAAPGPADDAPDRRTRRRRGARDPEQQTAARAGQDGRALNRPAGTVPMLGQGHSRATLSRGVADGGAGHPRGARHRSEHGRSGPRRRPGRLDRPGGGRGGRGVSQRYGRDRARRQHGQDAAHPSGYRRRRCRRR